MHDINPITSIPIDYNQLIFLFKKILVYPLISCDVYYDAHNFDKINCSRQL